MNDHMLREILAVRLFEERAASVFAARHIEEAVGRAERRMRRRKRRERIVRLLKALAIWLSPNIALQEHATDTLSTAT